MFTADMIDANEAVRIGLAEYAVPLDQFDAEIERLVARIIPNSPFSHAANKKLLEATDMRPMDAGLQWEVMETAGIGPEMAERIAAFTKN
jgi:enoyl-CoA hydratase/carnithine racemase